VREENVALGKKAAAEQRAVQRLETSLQGLQAQLSAQGSKKEDALVRGRSCRLVCDDVIEFYFLLFLLFEMIGSHVKGYHVVFDLAFFPFLSFAVFQFYPLILSPTTPPMT
jgi:hypothetical protein